MFHLGYSYWTWPKLWYLKHSIVTFEKDFILHSGISYNNIYLLLYYFVCILYNNKNLIYSIRKTKENDSTFFNLTPMLITRMCTNLIWFFGGLQHFQDRLDFQKTWSLFLSDDLSSFLWNHEQMIHFKINSYQRNFCLFFTND